MVVIVEGGDVVDGEFYPETGSVNDEECPDAIVFNRQHERLHTFAFCGFEVTSVTELFIVPIGCVLGKEVIRETRDKQSDPGNNHCQSPSEEFVYTETEHGGKDEGHHHLRDTAAEVPPACRCRIRCPDTVRGEHC